MANPIEPFRFEVNQYRKRVVIGCAADEQTAAQEVVFDIVAHVSPDPRLLLDTWEPIFDYCCLLEAVDAACAKAQVKILQEALAYDVVHRVFTEQPMVERLDVLTRKTERYTGTDSIGFRLRLSRSEWQQLAAQVDRLQVATAPSP